MTTAKLDSNSRILEFSQRTLPWLFFLVMSLGIGLILIFNPLDASDVTLSVGDIAPDDIISTTSTSFESAILTANETNAAIENVDNVYTDLDRNTGREQTQKVIDTFDYFSVVRADGFATPERKLDYLNAVDGITVPDDVLLATLDMSEPDFLAMQDVILASVSGIMRTQVKEDEVELAKSAVTEEIDLNLQGTQVDFYSEFTPQLVIANSFVDQQATQQAKDEAANNVEDVIVNIQPRQIIVQQGQTIDEADIELLGELGLLKLSSSWQVTLSRAILGLLSALLLTLYWRNYFNFQDNNTRYLIITAGLLLVFILAGRVVGAVGLPWAYLFPLAALSMTFAVLYDPRFAILATMVVAIVVGFVASNSLELTAYLIAGGLAAILTLRDTQRLSAYLRSGIAASLAQIAVLLVFQLPFITDWYVFASNMGMSLGNGIISAMLTIPTFFFLGSVFGVITSLQVQELSRLNHPLLVDLLRKAPGTYHHSLMVSNLAEQAAERFDADSTLVRVGALYHDIGKMNAPGFFTENQESGVNPHDRLDSLSSARIILSHVSDGLDLAKQYKLPLRIRDFIAEHQGTRVISFYQKAVAQAAEGEVIDMEKFRYPGPRPQSRETGIVMLADVVESASSALRPDTEAAIEKLVNGLIDQHIAEGQLDDSDLTLGELQIIRKSFADTLQGRFHVRIRYPGNEDLEDDPPTPLNSQPNGPRKPLSGPTDKVLA